MTPFNCIILRYNEIGLKGDNRGDFEKIFRANIRHSLPQIVEPRFLIDQGRHALRRRDNAAFDEAEIKHMRERLPRVFGLETFSPAVMMAPNADEVIATATQLALDALAQTAAGSSFRVRVRRAWKKFPYSSRELEIAIAESVGKQRDFKFDLEKAETTLYVEVREDIAYIYFEVCAAHGGLPVGSSHRVLALLSGGLDSPVACVRTMKRGAPVDYITFHSFPYTKPELLDKIAGIAQTLDTWQGRSGALHACNMAEAQKMIRDSEAPERFRTLLYRRLMLRCSTVLAARLHARALVTGETAAQVASQTLPNMDSIGRATDLLVLRPLVSFDKNETMALARVYGTYHASNVQCEDSCTTFAPKSPATHANPWLLNQAERCFDLDAALVSMLSQTCVLDPVTRAETPVPGLVQLYRNHFAYLGQPPEQRFTPRQGGQED